MKPKVTIGLCVRNEEKKIKEAIDSVLHQDCPHELMEVIVVDGCSTDQTISVIKKSLSKTDIKSVILYENKGLTAARNMVVDRASGDYIVWVDGDMKLARDHVTKQVEFMEQNPNIGIAGGKFRGWPGDKTLATLESIEWTIIDHETERKATSKPLRHFCGGTIYRVKAIRQVGGFDEKAQAGEDLDAEYRIGKAGWLLYFLTDAEFHDRRRDTWKDIWKENFWYGYGIHYILHKNQELCKMRMAPRSIFLAGFHRCYLAYKLTRQKLVFLFLPLYFFKKVAELFGFAKAHIDRYGYA